MHLLNISRLLTNCGGDGVEPHGPPFEFQDYRLKDSIVHFIQPAFIHAECIQTEMCDLPIDHSVALNHGEIPHSTQQGIRDPWRTPAPSGDLEHTILLDTNSQQAR